MKHDSVDNNTEREITDSSKSKSRRMSYFINQKEQKNEEKSNNKNEKKQNNKNETSDTIEASPNMSFTNDITPSRRSLFNLFGEKKKDENDNNLNNQNNTDQEEPNTLNTSTDDNYKQTKSIKHNKNNDNKKHNKNKENRGNKHNKDKYVSQKYKENGATLKNTRKESKTFFGNYFQNNKFSNDFDTSDSDQTSIPDDEQNHIDPVPTKSRRASKKKRRLSRKVTFSCNNSSDDVEIMGTNNSEEGNSEKENRRRRSKKIEKYDESCDDISLDEKKKLNSNTYRRSSSSTYSKNISNEQKKQWMYRSSFIKNVYEDTETTSDGSNSEDENKPQKKYKSKGLSWSVFSKIFLSNNKKYNKNHTSSQSDYTSSDTDIYDDRHNRHKGHGKNTNNTNNNTKNHNNNDNNNNNNNNSITTDNKSIKMTSNTCDDSKRLLNNENDEKNDQLIRNCDMNIESNTEPNISINGKNAINDKQEYEQISVEFFHNGTQCDPKYSNSYIDSTEDLLLGKKSGYQIPSGTRKAPSLSAALLTLSLIVLTAIGFSLTITYLVKHSP